MKFRFRPIAVAGIGLIPIIALAVFFFKGAKESIEDFAPDYIKNSPRSNNPPMNPDFFFGLMPDKIRRVRFESPFDTRFITIYAEFTTPDFSEQIRKWENTGYKKTDFPHAFRFFRPPAWFKIYEKQKSSFVSQIYGGPAGPYSSLRGGFTASVYHLEGSNHFAIVMCESDFDRKQESIFMNFLMNSSRERFHPPKVEALQ